jgi:hypothetical protein
MTIRERLEISLFGAVLILALPALLIGAHSFVN